jgi:hypothetical protein
LHISPDQIVIWKYHFIVLNSTIVTTWGLMLVMVIGAMLITRKIKTEGAISRWQGFLEIVVTTIQKQLNEVGLPQPEKFIGFLGTLFLFVAFANLCTILPFYDPPTGSLSTTLALALCVFVAVPLYGIMDQNLYPAHGHHAAVQYHYSAFEDDGPGCPSLRKCDERDDARRHFAHDHAPLHPRRHEFARPPDRHGAGLYLCHSRDGLHRGRHGIWRCLSFN